MKKQIAGILTGLLVCGVFLGGCGKNEATEAVKESVETEKEGTGDTETAENGKEDKTDSQDAGTEEDSKEDAEETQVSREDLDKVGVLLPEEGEDINSSLERTELKSCLEEAGYNAALYFADEDADTQISQIQELLQDEKLKALVISPVDPYSLSDVLEQASEQSIPVIDYDDLIMDSANVKYFITFNTRAIGKEIAQNIIKNAELDKVREDRGARTIEFLMGSPDDDASLFLFNGIMEELQEYIEDGTLICRSGRQTFDENSIMDENTDAAMKQLESVTGEFYSLEKTPDIICTASDDFALAVHIFKMLNRGVHPFSGDLDLDFYDLDDDDIPPAPSLNTCIREGQSPFIGTSIGYAIPDYALRLDDFGSLMGEAFRRSLFGRAEERINARTWARLLDRYLSETIECAHGHLYHFYHSLQGECPYCRGERALLARLS